MTEHQHPREHYRIPYPRAARPLLVMDDREYQVIDVSEWGIRYDLGRQPAPAVGDAVRGSLYFKRGEEAMIRGHVVRVQGRHVAVRLDIGIPFKQILDEQRYLRDAHRGIAW